ncbi:saccharopine dehydrogenase NADP-binding domain-containing protein [Salinactinospora qingdaonensis]|uniref:Saccharopine dehydrogenase NADP-binding domain-containing protein n=1 Tax=Salinactinospora qingdaonensis TaxID=702744 RepID=A0ABP7FF18_9ACTN
MSADERVAVIGVTGGAGRAALAELRRAGVSVRAASRSSARAADVLAATEGEAPAEAVAADVTDPAALAACCAGCRVVVDCCGPVTELGTRVAAAAAAAGADYVAAAGDEPFRALLAHIEQPPSWTAVVSAGMMPGLTGLLPRWLAADSGAPAMGGHLTGYVGGRDRFTYAAAVDYLAGLGEEVGTPMAVWRNGRVRGAPAPRSQTRLPFFPGQVTAQPYLPVEIERVARAVGLAAVDWYSVFDGTAVLDVLTAAGGTSGGADAAALMRAAELDLFGRSPYQLIVLRLDSASGGAAGGTGLVLRGTDASALTGTTAALAALAVLRGEAAPGVGHAAEVLDADRFVARLADAPAVTAFERVSGPAVDEPAGSATGTPVEEVEEGTL